MMFLKKERKKMRKTKGSNLWVQPYFIVQKMSLVIKTKPYLENFRHLYKLI